MTSSSGYVTRIFSDPKCFWIVQGILIPLFVSSAWLTSNLVNYKPLVPELNNTPRVIRPEFDYPFVVSDSQLQSVLFKIRPRFKKSPPKINFIDHALRLWGRIPQIESESYSGKQLYRMLTDHPTYRSQYGTAARPLLKVSAHGIEVTTRETRTSVSHVDHLMGTLAEIGTPLSYEVKTPELEGRVGDILNHAVRNFRLNQREYEWTALALALYIKDDQTWYSADGQELDFDRIAERTMRQSQPQGVCYGQHRLYTLAMLLRINQQLASEDQSEILSPGKVEKINDYLLDMTRRFYKSQSAVGYWDGNWHDAESNIPDPRTDELSRRLLATGHALEWWAMAPQKLHPPRETIVRASQWLAKTIIEMDDKSIEANYTFLTHSARSLVLWRGKFAEEMDPQELTDPEIRISMKQ